MKLNAEKSIITVAPTEADVCIVPPSRKGEMPRVLLHVKGDGNEASVHLELGEAIAVAQLLMFSAMQAGGAASAVGSDPLEGAPRMPRPGLIA